MDFQAIPQFVLDTSQDICELVLTRQVDLASHDGYDAAALAHRTFVNRTGKRPPLSECQVLRNDHGLAAYEEVLAFVVSCTDSLLQITPHRATWLAARQECYRTVMAGVAYSGQFSETALRSLDELIVQRSTEYGPGPLSDAGLVLSTHLLHTFKADALPLAASTWAYFVSAAAVTLDLGGEQLSSGRA